MGIHIFKAFIAKLSSTKVIPIYIFTLNLWQYLFLHTLTNTKYFNFKKLSLWCIKYGISLLFEFKFFDVGEIELSVFFCRASKTCYFVENKVDSPPRYLYLLLPPLYLRYKKSQNEYLLFPPKHAMLCCLYSSFCLIPLHLTESLPTLQGPSLKTKLLST